MALVKARPSSACAILPLMTYAETLVVVKDVALVVLAVLAIVWLIVLIIVSLALLGEVRPILRRTQEILNNARGTTAFISETIVQPIIRVAGFMAGVRGAVGVLGRFGSRRGG
jgi:hypothetical protein